MDKTKNVKLNFAENEKNFIYYEYKLGRYKTTPSVYCGRII